MAEVRGKYMNNKLLIRIISLVMAVSVVFAVGGCGKKDSAETNTEAGASTESSDASIQEAIDGKGSPVQPSIDEKASTAVIKYTKVNSEGKKEDATTVVNVKSPIVNEITMSAKLSDQYKTDAQKLNFVNNATKNSDIEKSKAEEIINKAEEWVEFGYTAYIANTSSQRLITAFLEIGGSSDNIIVKKNLDCEYSIKSGMATTVYISGYVNVEKYPDEESIIKELNDMKIKLVYTLADDSVTDIDNWDEVTQKTMDIKFG